MADTSLSMIIKEKSIAMQKGDYFGALGLDSTADGNAVQKAYFVLAKSFHPDKLNKDELDAEQVQEARKIFEFMTQAFNVLSDASKRKSVAAGEAINNPHQSNLSRGDDAQIFMHQGLKMMRMRAWDKAEEFFRKAIKKDAQNVDILCHLGWSVFNNSKKKESVRLEEARQVWEQAVKLEGKHCHANYYMSLYYKSVKKTKEQRIYLQNALDSDSDFVEAQREMRLLKMRAGNEDGETSLLAKLFPSFIKK